MPTKTHEHSTTTTDAELALNGGYEYTQGSDAFVPGTSIDAATAADVLDHNPNIRRKFLRLIASGVGASAVALLLAACGPNGTPTSTETHAATGTPSPEATHNPDVFERTDPLPANLAPLKTMDNPTFETQKDGTKLTYGTWLAQYKAAYEARYSAASGLEQDKPAVLTASSTGADLFNAYEYNLHLAASMDVADGEKFLMAHFEGTTDTNPTLADALKTRDELVVKTRQWSSKNPGDAVPASILAELASDGYGRVQISYENGNVPALIDGKLVSVPGTIMTFQNNNGDGIVRHQEFHVEAVKSYDEKTTVYEVVAGDIYV